MALISMKHVTKIYPKGTRPALDDVDLEIERGNFVFLVGASGSGKSTLLSLLLHEELATDGEIRVAGNDLRRLSNRRVPQYRRSIGFVFQDYKLLTNKTVWQNVAFALEVIGTRRSTVRSLVPQVLKTVGLTGKEKNFPHELSGGEAQRVAIARAYVNHPQILLADEPTGNLDPTTSLGIMEVLDAINRTGTTVVMATHNEEIVNSMRKRVVELHSGKIVRDERSGSYDSAKFFPDADVAAKAHQALKRGAAVDVASAATTGAMAQPLSSPGLLTAASQSSEVPSHEDDAEQSKAQSVISPDAAHENTSVKPESPEQQRGASSQAHSVAPSDSSLSPVAAEDDEPVHQAATPGHQGVEDEQVEKFAGKQGTNAHETDATETATETGTSSSHDPTHDGERSDAAPAPNEGIARLAKSLHSGKTGRYGKIFAPVEDTLTWGKGITADDVKAASNPPTPPASADHEEDKQ